MNIPRLVISGTHSGVGKTTITLALMAALSRRGLSVQPFKIGPDYLDPLQHRRATGRVSRNLDSWMLSRESLLRSFAAASAGADIAVVEGMMGLFDGKETPSEEGSTAQIAKWLSAPVLLVVDAGGMARSLGALLQGFQRFDPELPLSGALFSRASGAGHLRWLEETARPYLKTFGGLPEEARIKMPERHLGLVHREQTGLSDRLIDNLIELAEAHLNIDALVDLAREARPLKISFLGEIYGVPLDIKLKEAGQTPLRCRIAVGRDEAFHFYYPDNLELLERAGAELVGFSPIHDARLPKEIDGIYLGGGYPEVYAEALSANGAMHEEIRRFAESDGPVYAECGGMMYLTRDIHLISGRRFPMVGLIPGGIQMSERLSRIGYVEVEAQEENPLLELGEKARGHEFHYSDWGTKPAEQAGLKRVYRLCHNGQEIREGYLYRNVLASYIHLHFGSNPRMAATFVDRCERWKRLRHGR